MAVFSLIIAVVFISGCPPVVVVPPGPGPGPVYYNSITVYNYSYSDIVGVYISPCNNSSWGSNQLYYVLQVNEVITIYDIPNGCYDFLAEDSYGGTWDLYSIYLSNGENYDITLTGKRTEGVKSDVSPPIDAHQVTYLYEENTGALKVK